MKKALLVVLVVASLGCCVPSEARANEVCPPNEDWAANFVTDSPMPFGDEEIWLVHKEGEGVVHQIYHGSHTEGGEPLTNNDSFKYDLFVEGNYLVYIDQIFGNNPRGDGVKVSRVNLIVKADDGYAFHTLASFQIEEGVPFQPKICGTTVYFGLYREGDIECRSVDFYGPKGTESATH